MKDDMYEMIINNLNNSNSGLYKDKEIMVKNKLIFRKIIMKMILNSIKGN